MKIESLREFVIVAKHLNFTNAAKELFTTQPGLSTRIATMEKALGYPLFERSKNRIALTAAGSVLLEYAQTILGMYQKAIMEAESVAKKSTLRISSLSLASEEYRRLPQNELLNVVFVDLGINTSEIDALLSRKLDLAFGINYSIIEELQKEAEELGVIYHPTGFDYCSICMMSKHKLASKTSLSREDLAGQTIVINSGSHFDRWSKMLLCVIGDEPKVNFRLNSLESASGLSYADFGESLYLCGGDNAKQTLGARSDVVIFDKLDGQPLLYPTALIHRVEQDASMRELLTSFVSEFQSNLVKH